MFHVNCKRFYMIVYKSFTYTRLSDQTKTLLRSNKNKNILILGLIPVIPSVSANSPSIQENSGNLSNSDSRPNNVVEDESVRSDDEKTPWERVKAMYEIDEFGNYSKEIITTLHTSYMALFVGFIYGGVQRSRIAFIDYMERNQATIFDNHLDAKRRLQNHVTIHFAKGAFQWGWRLTAFTGGFTLLFLTLHAYRGTESLIDYAASGAIMGALTRVKLGPPGIIIGGAVGGFLGLFCGMGNLTMLSLFGRPYDDILEMQYNIDRERTTLLERQAAKDFEKNSKMPKEAFEMLELHGEKKES